MTMTAPEIVNLFFNHWYYENGLPLDIISDRDKIFTSKFWTALHRLTGIHLKFSTAYPP
jgi:antitoxin component of RelBE/YafQ-DinJ toxin-antitoxin module